jgi:signal-transduction protein with cAMP-binding, CBS, and nucleotidyltransferase domain
VLVSSALVNKLSGILCCLRWDEHQELQFYSESVEILFFAIYTTVNQLGESASALQNRDVRKHMIELVSSIYDPIIMNCIMLCIAC